MNHHLNRILLVVVTTMFIHAAAVHADPQAESARQILSRYKDAVVTVKLVVSQRISIGGQDQKSEARTEAIGSIIDPSGLTVVSLSAIDPSKTLGNMIRSRAARSGQSINFSIETEVTEANLILADGAEIPVVVVLRDKELDLAYLKPKQKPAQQLVSIDIGADPKAALLDQLVCLNRLGKVANRVASVSLERVNAIVERPRLFYILGLGQGTSGVGSPVFTVDGKLLGLMLIRSVAADGDGNLGSMFSGSESLGLMPVVVPAIDVRDGAKQALEKVAKDQTEKTEEKASPTP